MLISAIEGGLKGLPEGASVGTSSPRRAKQLLWMRPDLEVVDIRGNVPTRLRKVAEGQCNAIMLAEAGLNRLGYSMEKPAEISGVGLHFSPLDENEFFPAAGQGAIGFEVRADDDRAKAMVDAIVHDGTFRQVRAEREFLRLLEGGCHTPVGVVTVLDGDTLSMKARVFPDEGGEPRTSQAEGKEPLEVARDLFESLA